MYLEIDVGPVEIHDAKTNTFTDLKKRTVRLGHSLISISKWEAEWGTNFIPAGPHDHRTAEQLYSYLRCMVIGDVPEPYILEIWASHYNLVEEYIQAPMTATTLGRSGSSTSRKVTSEEIYYWMIHFGIPNEYETWHLNRLMTLIRVCHAKLNPKKVSASEKAARQAAINEKRRLAMEGANKR